MKALIACAAVVFAASAAGGAYAWGSVLYPDWESVMTDPFPLWQAAPSPVLTHKDVTDAAAYFVADPFLMLDGGAWYMFLEILVANPPRAVIGLATSANGLDWSYDRVVIDDGIRHSYPFVFRYEGEFYMLPETDFGAEVRLYHAESFPHQWEHVATILGGDGTYVDPTLFRYDETWWLFAGGPNSSTCRLFFSDSLTTGWTEHPMSPIAVDPSRSRPAGRALIVDGDRILRMAQKSNVTYGEAVRVFEVDVLTRFDYHEFEIPESPVLNATGSGWNSEGMHQCDAWWTGDHWIAAVDGISEGRWAIGIYGSEEPSSAPSATGAAGSTTFLRASPNPASGGVTIRYRWPGGTDDLALEIYDPAGRRIRTLSAQSGGLIAWDGRDGLGGDASSGTYFMKLSGPGRSVGTRVIVLR